MFNATAYFRDHRVDFKGPDHQGWVNIQCPFCRSAQTGSNPDKKYLGYNMARGYLHCWRCGPHSTEDLIMAMEGVEYHVACARTQEYDSDLAWAQAQAPRQARRLACSLDWPGGTLPMQGIHKQYLVFRGFDPDYLEARYGLMGTVSAGAYANRIMIPIFSQGRMVSYQGRTIVKEHEPKYKACPKDRELIDHRELLYDLDNVTGESVMVVEGMFDAWRLGDGAVATFGTSLARTSPQIMLLTKFKRVFIIFDAEPKAQAKARALRDWLSVLGAEAMNVELASGDPGELTPAEAQEMRRGLLR